MRFPPGIAADEDIRGAAPGQGDLQAVQGHQIHDEGARHRGGGTDAGWDSRDFDRGVSIHPLIVDDQIRDVGEVFSGRMAGRPGAGLGEVGQCNDARTPLPAFQSHFNGDSVTASVGGDQQDVSLGHPVADQELPCASGLAFQFGRSTCTAVQHQVVVEDGDNADQPSGAVEGFLREQVGVSGAKNKDKPACGQCLGHPGARRLNGRALDRCDPIHLLTDPDQVGIDGVGGHWAGEALGKCLSSTKKRPRIAPGPFWARARAPRLFRRGLVRRLLGILLELLNVLLLDDLDLGTLFEVRLAGDLDDVARDGGRPSCNGGGRRLGLRLDVDQFDFKMSGEETIDGAACWKIEARPKQSKSSQYTHSLLWIRKDNYVAAQNEGYTKNGLARRIQYREIQNVSGHWTARRLEVLDSKTGSRTVLKLEKLQYDVPLSENEFTLQSLRRS